MFHFFVTECLCLESAEFKIETVVVMTKIRVETGYSRCVQERAAINAVCEYSSVGCSHYISMLQFFSIYTS
jgi:hypothetical protein